MKRANQLFLLGLLACAGAWAQGISSVRVGLTVEGARFRVDGQEYTSTQNFLWPFGSKHVIQFPYNLETDDVSAVYQYYDGRIARYAFGGWKVIGSTEFIPAGSDVITVTASDAITEIIGDVTIEHRIHINFPNSPPNQNVCSPMNPDTDVVRSGVLYLDGTCFGMSSDEVWIADGEHSYNVFAYPGWVFDSILVDGHGPPDPAIGKLRIDSRVTLTVIFIMAKRVKFNSVPPGLGIYVDSSFVTLPPNPPTSPAPPGNRDPYCVPDYSRIPGNAPLGFTPLCMGDFDFIPNSVHRLAAPEFQPDIHGVNWVFDSFSTGGGQNSTYLADDRVATVSTVQANFVRGWNSNVLTNYKGLKIEIDGRSNWPGPVYGFVWGEGHKHHVKAPLEQTDAQGRKYRFVSWSDGGEPEHDILVPAQGITITANYELLGQIKVLTVPAGLKILVNGTECPTPCVFDESAGEVLNLVAPANHPINDVSRYDFESWSGGPAGNQRQATFTGDAQVITAHYHGAHRVLTYTNPADAATFEFTPASSDGFFAEGTDVAVRVVPKSGNKFLRWGGDLSGNFSPGRLKIVGPAKVVANFEQVPAIAPAGIRNAAGDTPDDTIAPGSIMAIYGKNLSAVTEIGPSNPWAQAIGNVYVTVNNRLLPLILVSPEQINAQMLSDFPDGEYTLVVHQVGQADVTGTFRVKRNSPGLFHWMAPGGKPIVAALHQDGTPITPESPARRGEIVTLYGTGLGPYDKPVIDGFTVPSTQLYPLVDSLAILAGPPASGNPPTTAQAPTPLSPAWAGAAPGLVGASIVQLKIDEQIPAGSPVELFVSVNGVESNRAQLPVE